MQPVALSIAGSDPSGGAGIQADLKVFHRFGVYGEAAITLLTVQNTSGILRMQPVETAFVREQIEAVISEIPPHAAKIGALGTVSTVYALADLATTFTFPLIVDPVMAGKHGDPLLDLAGLGAVRSQLLPRAFLITPNIPEAAALTGRTIETVADMRDAAQALVDLGASAALVKGGHMDGDPVDVLLTGGNFHEFAVRRVDTRHTHGTGCAYSAAITAGLANGRDLLIAVAEAKEFVTRAIQTNPGLGSGAGPLNFWS